ncbi:MAG: TlpA family protein disulfide reductase [Desulfobacterales bacterium]|nr:MAG: TlpA family protein disulfide reductase [Desulfobacterales bacterium]
MMKPARQIVILIAIIALFTAAFSGKTGWCGGLPQKGDTLPSLELEAPSSDKDRAYLGITGQTFRLGDIRCRLLLFEVIGIYCPQCYRQAPLFNTLFSRIEKGKLQGRIKMLALAAGGNVAEIQYLLAQRPYSFPIVPDPAFEAHKLLGEPRTPFTLLVDPQGKVLHTHKGVVEDIDAFLKLMTDLVP